MHAGRAVCIISTQSGISSSLDCQDPIPWSIHPTQLESSTGVPLTIKDRSGGVQVRCLLYIRPGVHFLLPCLLVTPPPMPWFDISPLSPSRPCLDPGDQPHWLGRAAGHHVLRCPSHVRGGTGHPEGARRRPDRWIHTGSEEVDY